MNIVFERIKYKNFLSVGNTFVELELNSHRKNLIIGANGSAKSALLCALTFALFGKPFRKIKKPNIVNSVNKKNCLVELEFSIGEKKYKIIRGLSPAIFEIYQDGILINQDAASKDYQLYLETNIIKTNYKSFTQVVILGSARYVPFMLLPAADRRDIIEDLLDIQIFTTMNILVKEKLSVLKDSLLKLKYELDLLNEKISGQKNLIKEEKKKYKSDVNKKLEDIENYSTLIKSHKDDLVLIELHVQQLTKRIIKKSTTEKKKQQLLTLESKAESNIKKFKKELEFFSSHDSCPTCKQQIDEKFKKNKIETVNTKKDRMEEGLMKLSEEITTLDSTLKSINEIALHINEHHKEISRLNSSVVSYENFIEKLQEEINSIKNNSDNRHEIKLQELEYQHKSLIEKQKELMSEKKYLDHSATLLKDGGIKTKIVKQYLPVLNKLINYYLGKFEFFVNFNIDENFDEVIKSRNRDTFSYSNFSEGEKLRIDLSILLSFRQLTKLKSNISCNLLLLDEILDANLDKEGVDFFLDLLDEMDSNTNVFVISHRTDDIKDRFDRILKFEVVKNFSRVKQL